MFQADKCILTKTFSDTTVEVLKLDLLAEYTSIAYLSNTIILVC